MASTNPEHILAALHAWRSWAIDQRFPVPEPAALVAISRDPKHWADGPVSAVEIGWQATIDHLCMQVELGVTPEVAAAHVPDRLRRAPDLPDLPTPQADARPGADATAAPRPSTHAAAADIPAPPDVEPAPADPATDDPQAAILRALFDWRTSQIDRGVDGADSIKDVTLRTLVRRNQTTVEQIRSKLTGAAIALAPEIAAVFARFTGAPAAEPVTVPITPDLPAPPAPTVASGAPEVDPSPTVPLDRPGSGPAAAPASSSTSAHPTSDPGSPHSDVGQRNWSHSDFCAYDYPETDVQPGRIGITPAADGVRLSWDPWPHHPGEIAIYRIVSSDETAPYKPESGELLGVSTDRTLDDARFPTSAARIYQVWCHVGPDEHTARATQPVLWASGEEVSPVEAMVLSEESGRVIGEWEVFPGTRSVRVFRIPLDGGAPPVAGPDNQICSDQPNLTGFVDAGVPRGKRFLYAAQAEVAVNDSARLSRPVRKDILVSVDLEPITDLGVTMDESGTTFALRWSTPAAGQHVRIHRFATPPPAGLENEDRDESAITVQGFTEATRIKDPVTALDPTTSQITGVLWPASWERAYLTPVTSFNGRVRIGTTTVQTRPLPPVTEPLIVERFNTEIITFGWPAGAAAVQVFIGPNSLTPEQICSQPQPFAEVTASAHRRDGAIILPQALPQKGCTVCLVPVAYSRGEQIRGEISTLPYRGLLRLFYWLEPAPHPDPNARLFRLGLRSPTEIVNPPALVVVANADRLPLDSRDGRNLQFLVRGQRIPHCDLPTIPDGAHPTEYQIDLTGIFAYVRLFVHEAAEREPRVALADPPLSQLWQFSPPAPPPIGGRG